jgi:hypothetical protein
MLFLFFMERHYKLKQQAISNQIKMATTLDEKFKKYITNLLQTNPSFRKAMEKATEEMPESKVYKRELHSSTISHVQTLYDITEEQAKDLWEKLQTFNELLIKKYGDTYFENGNEIMKLTQQYKERMIMKYKK